MNSTSHLQYSNTSSNWGICFIAQPSIGAAEGDTKEGVA